MTALAALLLLGIQAAPAPAAIEEPTTFFSDPRLLHRWDADATGPLSLARVFDRLHAERGLPRPKLKAKAPSSGALLAGFDASWGVVASTLHRDLDRIVTELAIDWEKDITKTYDVTAAKTEVGKDKWHRGNGNVVRIFEDRWLTSRDGQFLLSGVVYRPDRSDFDTDSCGELRLLYRLAYEVEMKKKTYASRMPFAVNVVYRVPKDEDGGCGSVARAWRRPALTAANVDAVAARLLGGPLDLSRVVFQQVELNAQVARFPSDLENVDRRRFAGQAIYWMRIFAMSGKRFAPVKLENTPDVLGIRRDPARKKALLEAIGRSLEGIDRGVFLLPEALLADVAISYSTLGSARLANRPFDVLITAAEAQALVKNERLTNPAFVTSGATLLERLDGATCMGCHQSSSTAGFHFLGVDRDFGRDRDAVRHATDGNRLQLPFSPHFYAEIPRRAQYLTAFAGEEAPIRVRPHPAAPPADWRDGRPRYREASTNMPCPLEGQGLPAAAQWTCGGGAKCQAVEINEALPFALGKCVPTTDDVRAGAACRADVIRDSGTRAPSTDLLAYNIRAFEDRVVRETSLYEMSEGKLTADAYNCRPSRIGVPLGRVTRQCKKDERSLVALPKDAEELCAVVGGKGFEEMARGYFDSDRFARGVGRGFLDACGPSRFCREDYICQQLPDFLVDRRHRVPRDTLSALQSQQIGFCTPTYFVYQLRLDGHPNPR